MNTHNDDDRNNLRYAEYVLGVLDADARAAVAREIASSDEAATSIGKLNRGAATGFNRAFTRDSKGNLVQR